MIVAAPNEMAPTLAAVEWQARRSELTHDWMRNRFLPRLHALMAVARGEAEASDTMVRQLVATVHEWRTRGDEVLRLADDYSEMLSPGRVVDELEPALGAVLASCVRCTASQSWRLRNRIDDLLADVRARHAAVEGAYERWTAAAGGLCAAAANDVSGLRVLAIRAGELLSALSRLPSRVVL